MAESRLEGIKRLHLKRGALTALAAMAVALTAAPAGAEELAFEPRPPASDRCQAAIAQEYNAWAQGPDRSVETSRAALHLLMTGGEPCRNFIADAVRAAAAADGAEPFDQQMAALLDLRIALSNDLKNGVRMGKARGDYIKAAQPLIEGLAPQGLMQAEIAAAARLEFAAVLLAGGKRRDANELVEAVAASLTAAGSNSASLRAEALGMRGKWEMSMDRDDDAYEAFAEAESLFGAQDLDDVHPTLADVAAWRGAARAVHLSHGGRASKLNQAHERFSVVWDNRSETSDCDTKPGDNKTPRYPADMLNMWDYSVGSAVIMIDFDEAGDVSSIDVIGAVPEKAATDPGFWKDVSKWTLEGPDLARPECRQNVIWQIIFSI